MNIAYCLVGTRRGHAARAISIGHELIHRGHKIRFFTDRDAMELLHEHFGPANTTHLDMPTYVEKQGVIQPLQTIWKNRSFFLRRTQCASVLLKELEPFKPDLLISDFEPLASVASRRYGIPLISLNSQNFIGHSTHAKLPASLAIQLQAIRLLTNWLCPSPSLRIACKAFVRPRKTSNTLILGPCLRPGIQHLKRNKHSNLVLAYLQDSQREDAARLHVFCRKQGLDLKLYGPTSVSGDLSRVHQSPSISSFTRDLGECTFLVCSAGSQLLAEAAYLGIPTLIRPEPHQPEQAVNTLLASYDCPYLVRSISQNLTVQELEAMLTYPTPSPVPQQDGSIAACNRIEQMCPVRTCLGLNPQTPSRPVPLLRQASP